MKLNQDKWKLKKQFYCKIWQ